MKNKLKLLLCYLVVIILWLCFLAPVILFVESADMMTPGNMFVCVLIGVFIGVFMGRITHQVFFWTKELLKVK